MLCREFQLVFTHFEVIRTVHLMRKLCLFIESWLVIHNSIHNLPFNSNSNPIYGWTCFGKSQFWKNPLFIHSTKLRYPAAKEMEILLCKCFIEIDIFLTELPEAKPILWTERHRYEPGDVLLANCSSLPSRPRVELKLTINNQVVSNRDKQS